MKSSDQIIYLDNAASTPLFPEVIEKYEALLHQFYPNPSASHKLALAIRQELKFATDRFFDALGISIDDTTVIWTSGGTEANNLAILGYCHNFEKSSKTSVVSSVIEHSSSYESLKRLEKQGAKVSWVSVDSKGQIDLEQFTNLLDESTRLVSICHVQNETGIIQDLENIREIMDQRASQAKLHIDAVQAFGKVNIPWKAARIDMMSLSSHKFHGPGGVGALLIRNNCRNIKPLLVGGGQQHNLRSGSLDACGIMGFLAAAGKMASVEQQLFDHVRSLNDRLREGLRLLTNKNGSPVEFQMISPETGSPYVVTFSFPGLEGAAIMRMLSDVGIIIGTGSACSAESKSPSRILQAIRLSEETAYGAIRVSFGFQNTLQEIDQLISQLHSVITNY